MTFAMSSALVAKPTPGRVGMSEKPKPGSDAATTWKLGAFGMPCAAGSVSSGISSSICTNVLGQPCSSRIGIGVRIAALRVHEVNARAVDGRRGSARSD